MIKSFFKRVFSSSEETAATTEQREETDLQLEGADTMIPHTEGDEVGRDGINEVNAYETVTVYKEWLDPPSYREINQRVTLLYQQAEQFPEADPIRLRLQLSENLQDVDLLTSKRINRYLSKAEQDIVDLTYFLDKADQTTMHIYREFLLPERIEQLNAFLQERCYMIYETSIGLGKDYKEEIELFFQALEMTITPSFFEEFDNWRTEVLRQHEQEQRMQDQQSVDDEQSTMIKISKEEVENENIQQIDHYLKEALLSPETAKESKGALLFSFYGFSKHEDLLKLMNRKDVNDWAALLVEKHPYIFYFLNNEDYPMTQFLTSLVVSTEVEDSFVYYNDEELVAFKQYIIDALETLAEWIQEDKEQIVAEFSLRFQ